MWTVRIPKRNSTITLGRSISSAYVCRQESRAQYPPILDVKPEPTLLRQELSYHEKIRNLGTVEEKSIGINMPRSDSFVQHYKILYYIYISHLDCSGIMVGSH